MTKETIIIGADHAGYLLKESLKPFLAELGFDFTDVGTDSELPVDYPDIASRVSDAVSRGLFPRGILMCGSGVGMSIVANRFPGVRAALSLDEETARVYLESRLWPHGVKCPPCVKKYPPIATTATKTMCTTLFVQNFSAKLSIELEYNLLCLERSTSICAQNRSFIFLFYLIPCDFQYDLSTGQNRLLPWC